MANTTTLMVHTPITEQAVYLAEDIQKALGLGKSSTYQYLQEVYKVQQPFRVLKIGRLFRVPKYSFDRWLFNDPEGI